MDAREKGIRRTRTETGKRARWGKKRTDEYKDKKRDSEIKRAWERERRGFKGERVGSDLKRSN